MPMIMPMMLIPRYHDADTIDKLHLVNFHPTCEEAIVIVNGSPAFNYYDNPTISYFDNLTMGRDIWPNGVINAAL